MAEPQQVGRIEFGPELTPFEAGRQLVLQSGLPKVIAEMKGNMIREAERAQLERDCAAICDYCEMPEVAEQGVTAGPAELINGIWYHRRTVTATGKELFPDRCRAAKLRKLFAFRLEAMTVPA